MAAVNDALNLVLTVQKDRIFAYHTPISREVFEANYQLIASTKAAIGAKGFYYLMDAGPQIAGLVIREEARKAGEERGAKDPEEDANALLAELRRLTMILSPTPQGWQMLPVDGAIAQGIIDADDWTEVESAIVFFTFHCALAKKSERAKVSGVAASLLKGLTTSSGAMDYVNSLQTSTQEGTTAPKVTSSLPS